MTTYRAFVEPAFTANGVAIHLGQQVGGKFINLRAPNLEYEEVQPGIVSAPAFIFDEGMAIELLRALSKHFDASTDTTHSREDYLVERKLTHKLVDHLIDINRGLIHGNDITR